MATNGHPLPYMAGLNDMKATPRRSATDYGSYKELVSDEYSTQIISRFKEFREEGKFCDVTLAVEDTQFKVHKLVLAGCSDYFRALFSHGMRDSQMDLFDLPEVSLQGFTPLLDFTYTGTLKVNFQTLPDVLSVATFLQMRPAIKLCQLYLQAIMSLEDSDEIVSLGMSYGLTELKHAQRRLILDHFLEFSETRKFYELNSESLIDYLKDDTLRVPSEGKLLKCVLRWYKYDKTEREVEMPNVLKYIRYVQTGWPLIDYAEQQEPFISNKHCKRLINFSEKYMQEPHRKHLITDYRTRVRFGNKSLLQYGGLVKLSTELNFPFLDVRALAADWEKVGYGQNHVYHADLGKWLGMGCIGQSDQRSHCPMVYVNDHCVLVGGYVYTQDLSAVYQHCTNQISLITPSEHEFSLWDMPYMHESRAHHVAVATPSFIYAIGGKNESGSLKSVEQLHMDTEIWSHIKPLPEALHDHAGASIGEQVYISGGVERGVHVKDVWMYNYIDGVWEEKPPLLYRRAGHTMTYVGGRLIVCGGLANSDTSRCLALCESYDVELQQWTLINAMPRDCAHMAATVMDDSLIIVGGVDSTGELLRAVNKYDVASNLWSHFCDLPAPMQSCGACAVTVKLSDGTEADTDSLCEEYENRILVGCGAHSDEDYDSIHSDDQLQGELRV